jgi:hypothetical protein
MDTVTCPRFLRFLTAGEREASLDSPSRRTRCMVVGFTGEDHGNKAYKSR